MKHLQINSKVYRVTKEGVQENTIVGIFSSHREIESGYIAYTISNGQETRDFSNYNLGKTVFATKEEALACYAQHQDKFRKELLHEQREEYCNLKQYISSRMRYVKEECVTFIEAKLTEIDKELTSIEAAGKANRLSVNTPIDDLGLSNRARNVLVCKCKLSTLADLLNLPKDNLASTKGVGTKSFSEIIAKIKSLGYDY